MALFMNPDFLTRHFSSVYVAVPTAAAAAATLLGVVATYAPRIFAGPAIEVAPQEIGEFAFHNGILVPHQEYLYGSSDTGEPFIVGKKLAGEDYSAWEAGYAKFARLQSATFTDSGSKSTWSWSFESKASTSSSILQLLLWLVFSIVCVLLLGYAVRKIVSRLSPQKRNNAEEILALPTSGIDAEHSKLNLLWRSTLISMYRERKSEVVSLSKLAVQSSRKLRKSITKEKKKKGKAKSALEKLKAEHAEKLAERQREMTSLRQMLDTQKARAQSLESTNRRIEAENTTAKETVKNLEEHIKTLQSDKEGESSDAKKPSGGDHPESGVTPKEAVAGDQDARVDLPVGSSAGQHGMAEATGPGEEDKRNSTKQNDGTPALDNQRAGPKLGKNGKPLKPRVNRRGDGSVRTTSHPDYVPVEDAPSWQGDRPFRGPDRDSDWKKGRGGGGGGRNGSARFGWRGMRGGGGPGGVNVHNGQSNQGEGQ